MMWHPDGRHIAAKGWMATKYPKMQAIDNIWGFCKILLISRCALQMEFQQLQFELSPHKACVFNTWSVIHLLPTSLKGLISYWLNTNLKKTDLIGMICATLFSLILYVSAVWKMQLQLHLQLHFPNKILEISSRLLSVEAKTAMFDKLEGELKLNRQLN